MTFVMGNARPGRISGFDAEFLDNEQLRQRLLDVVPERCQHPVNCQQAFAVERSQLVFVPQGDILDEAQNRYRTDWHHILRRLIFG